MKKSYIVMICTFLIALGLILKAFLLNESIKFFLVIFFFVGCGVGSLRIFVNIQIKKMKGKGLIRKILFFAVLLGVGIPFQNWFRVNVIMTMNRAFMPWNISIMVTGAIFITTFFGFIKDRMTKETFNLPVIEETSNRLDDDYTKLENLRNNNDNLSIGLSKTKEAINSTLSSSDE